MRLKFKGFFITISILVSFTVFAQKNIPAEVVDTTKAGEYVNSAYKFKAFIPSSWKLYGEVYNDTVRRYAIVDWGLPKVYSDLEKQNIENSISITAYNWPSIKSLQELIAFDNYQMHNRFGAVKIDSISPSVRIVYPVIRSIQYKAKQYSVYKNAIGYLIRFTATPGTFDKNIDVFEKFYKSLKFE